MKKKKNLPTYPTFLDRVGRGQTEVILNVALPPTNFTRDRQVGNCLFLTL